jgi:hypothetical protein
MQKEIKTQIEILAPPEDIWSALIDFKKYPAWNPFIKEIKGKIKKGNQILVQLPNMKFAPKLTQVKTNKLLEWKGILLFPFLFSGIHSFSLTEKSKGKTILTHKENFNGILIPLFKKQLENETKLGFIEMNKALKRYVENQKRA